MSLLSAEAVTKTYRSAALIGGPPPRSVLRGVDLAIGCHECVGLLGRSGSGKSTLARLLLGLEKPDAGRTMFRGNDIAGLRGDRHRAFRRAVQMVFQDSTAAVNPRHTIARILAEPMRHLSDLGSAAQRRRAAGLLASVGLDERDMDKLPGQMSGGQLQRVCIARALAVDPELIVLDEAVSNLDLVVRLQVLDLVAELRRRSGTAFLFVTHDLRLARRLCDRLIVMEEGAIVEEVSVGREMIFDHPASRALAAAVLPPRPRSRPPQAT
ncbi:nickel import ATP-binding protein NikE [Pseudochelatococcus sp. B33]